MMNTQQDSQISSNESSSVASLEVGKALREARERLGLSVNDVADRIKFAPKQIEWLEADDYARLPEAAFVRGFVRSYARLLELDSTNLINGLPSSYVKKSSVQEIKSVNVPMPTMLSARRYNIILLAAGLLIAVLVAVFERMHDRVPEQAESSVKTVVQQIDLPVSSGELSATPQEAQSAVVVAAQQTPRVDPVTIPLGTTAPVIRTIPASEVVIPEVKTLTAPVKAKAADQARALSVSSADSKVAPDNAVDHSLRLEFDEDAWVEVKEGSDKVLTSRIHTAGSLMRLTGKSPMMVVIGNVRAVRLFDNGKQINLERYTTADVAKVTLK
jgi:cytoskeleton protein RodZ